MDLFERLADEAVAEVESICGRLVALPEPARIEALNRIRMALHQISPFKAEPVDCVLWVPSEHVQANTWNPNHVANPEMRLLQHSIEADGYTQPIVTHADGERYEIVDGFHRSRVGKEAKRVRERTLGYLPVTTIQSSRTDLKDRMAATIRHNRARGVHGIMPMVDLVAAMIRQGCTDSEICKELGMEPDEVLRFKQGAGLPELFKHQEYSRAWENE